MLIFKKRFLASFILAGTFIFSSCKASNVIDISKQNFRVYFPKELSDGKIIDGIDGATQQELPNINNFSKLILTFINVYPYENTYDMLLTFNSGNSPFRYRLWTDGNINHNLQKPSGNIVIKKNTLNFKLIQGLFNSQLIYDFFDSEECSSYYGDDQILKTRKQYLYSIMLLYVNVLLNNLSKIY